MGANESDIKENNKDEIWYGWIPKLSHEMIVKIGDDNKIFDEVELRDLKEVFKDDIVLLSDKIIDDLLKKKHTVGFYKHKIISCECCKEKVWSVTVEIRKNNKRLIKGTANIHKSGLVRYEIPYNKVKEERSINNKEEHSINNKEEHSINNKEEHSINNKEEHSINNKEEHSINNKEEHSINKAQDIHKIVRDCLHFHLYHSSDMPLPPVKVDEKCDEDLAKEKILRMFLDAFIEYKREVGKVNLAKEEKDLSRALGEIIYANSALDKFSERKYLFSWDDVPKSNTEFIKFLKDELKIDTENAEIKRDNNETITVIDKNNNANLITIKLNKTQKKINLEIAGRKSYEYILKEENGKLNIYKEKNYEEFKKSFENFNESFKLLLQRTINRRDRISQRIMEISFIIAMLGIIQLFPYSSFPYYDELMKLSLLLFAFLILYVFAEIYKLREAPK